MWSHNGGGYYSLRGGIFISTPVKYEPGGKYINPFISAGFLKEVVWTYDTFEINSVIDNIFTKYLNESWLLCSDQHTFSLHFPKNALLRIFKMFLGNHFGHMLKG